jgi:hypothetical protein
MAAIAVRENAKPIGVTGLAGVRARASNLIRRATVVAAAAVMVCAVGAALLQLVVQLLGFPAPIAVTGITVLAVALLSSLRRHLCRPLLRHLRTRPGR